MLQYQLDLEIYNYVRCADCVLFLQTQNKADLFDRADENNYDKAMTKIVFNFNLQSLSHYVFNLTDCKSYMNPER